MSHCYCDIAICSMLCRSPRAAVAVLMPYIGRDRAQQLVQSLRWLSSFEDIIPGCVISRVFLDNYMDSAKSLRGQFPNLHFADKALQSYTDMLDRFIQPYQAWENHGRAINLSVVQQLPLSSFYQDRTVVQYTVIRCGMPHPGVVKPGAMFIKH